MLNDMKDPEAIIRDALELPSAERGRIAVRLIESLDDGAMPCSYTDDELATKIGERLRELESGSAESIDGKKAIEELRSELRNRRRG